MEKNILLSIFASLACAMPSLADNVSFFNRSFPSIPASEAYLSAPACMVTTYWMRTYNLDSLCQPKTDSPPSPPQANTQPANPNSRPAPLPPTATPPNSPPGGSPQQQSSSPAPPAAAIVEAAPRPSVYQRFTGIQPQ